MLKLHRQLDALLSLAPGTEADALFGELVTLCVATAPAEAERLLADPRIHAVAPRLRQLCSAGEYELETFWADRLVSASDALGELERFPYAGNYRALTRLELHAVAGVGIVPQRLRRVCFLGGGPLPLSAVCLAEHLDAGVDVVERDAAAVARSRAVLDRLGLSGRVIVHAAHAGAFAAVADCDLVVLAALVGADGGEKQALLSDLHSMMQPGAVLLIRSAHGLRTLLYPPVCLESLGSWEPFVIVHPMTEVVNSVLVAVRS